MTTEQTYTQIRDALVRVCKKTGRYSQGAAHEPKAAPGNGVSFIVLLTSETAIGGGLDSTSTLLTYNISSRMSAMYDPQDDIDVKLGGATRDVARRLSGNFKLGVDGVRSIDVKGIHGQPMGWTAGYVYHGDKWLRTFDLRVPIIINDAWPEDESDE